MEKRPRRGLFRPCSFAHMFCLAYPPMLWINRLPLLESRHRSPQPQRPNVVSEWARKRHFSACLL